MEIIGACESLQRRFYNFRVDFLNRMVNNMKKLEHVIFVDWESNCT